MASVTPAEIERQRRQSRIIYGVLAALMVLFLLFEMKLPFVVGPQALGLYDAVGKVRDDQLVLLSVNWEAGTVGESMPQTEALIQHLFLAKKRFAIFGIDPIGPGFAQRIAERQAERLGKTYGVDWVNWGYKPGQLAMFLGLARDIPGTIKQDSIRKADLTTLPVMRGIKSARDLGLILEVTSTDSIEIWIQYFHGVYGTPVGYAPTAVMVPEAYPYLNAKQLVGMLAGIKGAAEYADLLERNWDVEMTWEYPPRRAMNAVAIAHVLIVLLIVLGNYQYFTRHRRRAERT
ncbi:MAG: hypothetical protein HY321_07810 [Armatimonadetes bacterium]|nr:hypothetical protein [Armatimonadota bacterium]